jgi:serine/threonine protein phosphatase PrpC
MEAKVIKTFLRKNKNFKIGLLQDIGMRSEMEDVVRVKEIHGGLLAVICDGHGGAQCATFAASSFVSHFEDRLETNPKSSSSCMKYAVRCVVAEWDAFCFGEVAVPRTKRELSQFFKNTDLKEYEEQGKTSGATLVAVYVHPERKSFDVISLGDSRASWLVDGVLTSTMDQKPLKSKPRANFPCRVVDDNGVMRLNGELAMGSCIGDNTGTLFGCVQRKPRVTSFRYKKSQTVRFIIASDGFFDEQSEQNFFGVPKMLSIPRTQDNVTAITVDVTAA